MHRDVPVDEAARTKGFVQIARKKPEGKYALSDTVFSVCWHDGSVCRGVVWFRFGDPCADVTTAGLLRMLDGPLAGLEGAEGDDNEGECQKQILCWRGVSTQPRPGWAVVS